MQQHTQSISLKATVDNPEFFWTYIYTYVQTSTLEYIVPNLLHGYLPTTIAHGNHTLTIGCPWQMVASCTFIFFITAFLGDVDFAK